MFITNAQTMTRKWPKTMILSKRKITHFCTVSAIYICYHGFDNHSGGLFADCSKCININVLNFRLRELYLFFCETCLMPQLRQSGSNSKNNITSTIFHFFYFFFLSFCFKFRDDLIVVQRRSVNASATKHTHTI